MIDHDLMNYNLYESADFEYKNVIKNVKKDGSVLENSKEAIDSILNRDEIDKNNLFYSFNMDKNQINKLFEFIINKMTFNDIDFNFFNKFSHDGLVRILNQNECPKNLVFSKELTKIIDETIKFSELKENGVSKMFFLDVSLPKNANQKDVEWIYIMRPYAEDIKKVCEHIKDDLRKNIRYRYPYKIVFSPRKLYICDLLFEQEGIYEYVTLTELENDLIRIDDDVLSMEYPDFLPNYFMHGDQSWLCSIAKSLINIQNWFGKIPKFHLHGSCAKSVYELTKRLEELNENNLIDNHKIDQLILIDRNIDFITPFCTPLTYEGIISEHFKLNVGYIEHIPDEIKRKIVKLSNNDKIFENIRGMHISEIFSHLKKFLADLKNVHEKKKEINSVSEMKNFIQSDLKNYTELSNALNLHLNICEVIINQKTHLELSIYLNVEHNILSNRDYNKSLEYIEELINRQFDLHQILRLVILLSQTNQGIPNSHYLLLSKQILHNFGFDKIVLLSNLEKLGLIQIDNSALKKEDSKNIIKISQQLTSRLKGTKYATIAKKLDIIPGALDPMQLKSSSKSVDISYAFNGNYRPILCQYISQMLDDNPKSNFEEISKLFPGEYDRISTFANSVRNTQLQNRTVLIYFLGGCTYTELAILRKIANQKNYKFLFATTSFLNTEQVIDIIKN
ncbi:vacuolar sorting-associated 33B [Brachionus plicatilis]|uniref:Vacuolar sorting-associated 33B n=1 Tax=Brachionus plicatilis TaxID=10195 RepID=A0A3M7SPA5_BRAPC|nr:vacuolar sorting-associated 33B [Brachionus plicatilis]